MKSFFGVICLLCLLATTAFAGIDPEMLVVTLKQPKVQAALKGQDITSIKIVYDKEGRARFDFTIVVCSVFPGRIKDTPLTIYSTTRIDGEFAFFKGSRGEVTQVSGETEDPLCK